MSNGGYRGHGFADVLIGLQYGDEGKAKVIDLFGQRYDVIARFNGGANAGHTISTAAGKLALRQLPSGVLNDRCMLYIGSGCATNLGMLVSEIEAVKRQGIDLRDRLVISSRAAIIQPHHLDLDCRNGAMIGTTGNGIGPCYADRALRVADGRIVPVCLRDFVLDTHGTLARIEANAMAAGWRGETSLAAEIDLLAKAAAEIIQYVSLDDLFLIDRVESGDKVLFEGAQSIELDVSKGTMPYVTSSHTVPAYAYVGGDLPAKYHRRTIGVAKCIVSRVGNGPLPGEFGGQRSASYCSDALNTREAERERHDPHALLSSDDPFDVGMALRMLTDEYGTGTRRPRRIGMLDLVQLRKAVRLAGADVLFLNKCDCLSLYSKTLAGAIPVVTRYATDTEPQSEIKSFGSFDADASKLTARNNLPGSLKELLDFIERATGVPLLGMGFGPDRDRNIVAYELFSD
jgi:adenylosuccinate synthase